MKRFLVDELIVATPPDKDAGTKFGEFEHHVRLVSRIPIRHVVAAQAKPVARA